MLQTHVLTDVNKFIDLKGEWNQLLQRSHTNTIFLTWEWIYTWWEVFGKEGELFIITVENKGGELIGIAPLFIRKSKYYKFPVKEMTFIGMGHSDRQDFIILENNSKIIKAIISKIYENKNKWDIVNLDQIPSDSLFTTIRFIGNFQPEREASSLCPYVRIENSWEAYFKSLGKKFRRDIKHKTNRINRFGKWEFSVERTTNNLKKTIETMMNIEAKSRKLSRKKAFFSNKANKNFLSKFCQSGLQNKWFDYSKVSIDNKPIAYLLGFLYNNKYYAYNMSFSEDFHEASPGKLLLNEKIKWCFEHIDTVQEFDFLRGESHIKSLWTSENRNHIRIIFFNDSFYSKFIRYLAFRIRPKIKRLLRKDHYTSKD